MDFGIYPPEINSGRMYTGPGSGPMLAAAQAWGSLADELYTAASAYQSVVSELTSGSWSGPSSTSMTAAAGTYVEWLSATAAQAEETAAQARAAAAGYEAAFAMTVPPPEIAANRSLLAVLVATNFFGQNTPAIAATEAQYAEMWAQDAVAMYGYAGSSASATVLTPVHLTGPEHRSGRNGQPGCRGQPGHRHRRRQRAKRHIGCAAGVVRRQRHRPRPTRWTTLSDLISVFLSAPTDLVTLFVIIPDGCPVWAGGSSHRLSRHCRRSATRMTSSAAGRAGGLARTGTAPIQPFPATLQPPPGGVPARRCRRAWARPNTVGGLSVPSELDRRRA